MKPAHIQRPVVTIVQRRMTHYRVPLLTHMRALLDQRGITLRVLHGVGTPKEASKADSGTLPWAELLPTRYLFGDRICWQPMLAQAGASDLVIVTQENKLVHNLAALLNPRRRPAIAFWGHGRNMQSSRPDGPLERFKRWTTNQVDWWFAYTAMSADFVRADGFPAERITVLNNSIDTEELRAAVEEARKTPVADLRQILGLATQGPVGVYLGSLYADKRIDFLLDAARAVRAHVPSFQLAVAGDGPERGLVEAATGEAHVHYLGNVRGSRKAQLLAAADIMLNPGLVGLGILDAFVAGLPMLTTDCRIHSPEISYLQHQQNGLMTADDPAAYVAATVQLLRDLPSMQRLSRGAAAASEQYSIERMAQRFSDGICDCLQSTGHCP